MDNHLACACSTRLKTTLLMDRFERRDENGQPLYRELHLTDCFCVCRQGVVMPSLYGLSDGIGAAVFKTIL